MKLNYCSIMLSIILSMIGRASAEELSTQYQWTDPKTGQIVTRDYPPANLQMRQVERRGNLVILEVLGQQKFADSVNLNTPKSAEVAQDKETAAEKCLSKIKGSYDWKDSNSVRIEGEPAKTTTTTTGEVRQALMLKINGKNSYGAYSGPKDFTCVLGVDNLTPIKIIKWPD